MARIETDAQGNKIIVDTWGSTDIRSVAESDFEVELSDSQVDRVMDFLVEAYDGNHGITWEIISIAIDTVLNEDL